jgi:hypothetical protein
MGALSGPEDPVPNALPTSLVPAAPGAPMAAAVTVGTLVSRTFSTWGRNLVPFALVHLAIQVPILAIGWALSAPFLGGTGSPVSPTVSFGWRGDPDAAAYFFTWRYWTTVLVTSLFALVQMGALTSGAVQHLGGRRASVGEMLASGLRRAPLILVAGVLALIATYVGLFLIFVPGIIFALMFSLTVPVLMAEPVGPTRALGRSRALTKGHRWALLVLFLVAYLAGLAPGMLVAPLVAPFPVAAMVATVVVGAVMGPVILVAPAVAYHDLRTLKEGVSTEELLEVFA